MTTHTTPAVELMTPTEVAREFRVDPKTVTRWAKSGKLTSIRTLGGHRRYYESEVRALLGQGYTEVAPEAEPSPPPSPASTDEPERADDLASATTPPARCETCEQPFGTCYHTAPPIEVGDVITEATMNVGRSIRLGELRSNCRGRTPEGNEWVKTRRRDAAWENLTDGARWPLWMIIDEQQGYGPLTIEHIAGSR